MDADRFDFLTRVFTDARSRRDALGAVVGGTLGLLGVADMAAKKGKGKKKKKKKKRGGQNGTTPPPPPPCPSGMARCGGVCIDVTSDPRNCGSCGKRCQVNGVCSNGTCGCVIPGCANSEATCCPTATSCACGTPPNYWVDAGTCGGGGEVFVSSCPPGRTPCTGPRCRACCPTGSTCDTSTGTCLQ